MQPARQHPHVADFRESRLAEWKASDLAAAPTPAPARASITAPYIPAGSAAEFARFSSVSRAELQRQRVRSAIAIERTAAAESRALTAITYIAAGALLVLTVALYYLSGGSAAPTDAQAQADTAAALREAIAQAQAERPDLWTAEDRARADRAAVLVAKGGGHTYSQGAKEGWDD